ncbi:MAG: hypothetical protein QOE68_4810 [Thermoanaerobaculia bacterium]|jgi:uncharacterized membrane protein YhaH (DUF805 family)|nr:hypothetical protein [Thermoanaerobaculia bacterium]
MSSLFSRLWRLEGTVSRSTYAIGGVVAFALKYAIDWSIATLIFHRTWTPLSYWRMVGLQNDRVTVWMFLLLLIVSLPFLWFGMSMTLLRLRDARRSAGWAALFFVPVINVVLFIALSILPPRKTDVRDLSGVMESALFAIVATAALATAAIGLTTRALETYGIGLFVAVPFCVGYLSAFLHARRYPEARVQSYLVALLSTILLGGFLLALAWEGVFCLLMAAPLAIVLAMIGAVCGSKSARIRPSAKPNAPAYMTVAILPLLLIAEAAAHRAAPLYRVDSQIVIDAPAEAVWKNVVTFSDIGGQPEWFFRAGIAYPIRARINGRGVGATRTCEFTTGTFVEPIEVWNEPRLLRFGVTSNPPPMRELSPYAGIDAPHLHGFLVSQRGQFALESLPDGRTRLTGSTWYQHHLWPAEYWRLWSDAIIHRIHLRVLRHIKVLSERTTV